MTSRAAVDVIGVPTDYGTNRRGVDMGPSAIRYAGLADELSAVCGDCRDTGNLAVPRSGAREARHESDAKFLSEVMSVAGELADAVAETLENGRFPLVLGGDHSVAIGTINGTAREAATGVVWLDAHGDFNTPETTPSGNVHGMPLAAVLGEGSFGEIEWARAPGVREEKVALVGLRELDRGEREAIRESDVTAFTMTDVDQRGISAVVEDALDIAASGTDRVHVSLDLDWLDPNEAPGVGTPVRGGVSYREAHTACEAVAERSEVASLELVEVNPVMDEHNETAALAT